VMFRRRMQGREEKERNRRPEIASGEKKNMVLTSAFQIEEKKGGKGGKAAIAVPAHGEVDGKRKKTKTEEERDMRKKGGKREQHLASGKKKKKEKEEKSKAPVAHKYLPFQGKEAWIMLEAENPVCEEGKGILTAKKKGRKIPPMGGPKEKVKRKSTNYSS